MKTLRLLAVGLALLGSSIAQQIGSVAPEFKLADLSGQTVSLATLEGQPSVITFWASWCTVCRAELPKLHALAQKKKLRYYVISREPADTPQVVSAYMKPYPAFTPLVSLPGGDNAVAVYNRYKIVGQPWTFVLDRSGKIVAAHAGAVDPQTLEQELAQAGVP
jgi:thiol-disulfide isomerase/thioredoxin